MEALWYLDSPPDNWDGYRVTNAGGSVCGTETRDKGMAHAPKGWQDSLRFKTYEWLLELLI